MIDGITVLNHTEIVEVYLPGMILVSVLFIILVVFTGLLFDSSIPMCIVGCIGISLLLNNPPTMSTGRYQYECTIDKSVSMKEVYEKYEVIEQRGDIWVLEDKE